MANTEVKTGLTAEEQIALSQNAKKKHEASLKRGRIISNIVIYIILSVMAIIWLLPIVWLVLQSLNVEYGSAGLNKLYPEQWGILNYRDLFENQYFTGRFRSNGEPIYAKSAYIFFLKVENGAVYFGSFFYTLFVAIISSLISTLFVLATSYAFSRLRFKARAGMMRIILLLGMFPGFLGLIVLFEIFNLIGMNENIWSLVIVYSGGAGMGYYISKGFFDTISKQIDEAAMIDGATRFQIFYKITLPLAKPIIVYQVLTSFMGPWAEFMTSNYLLRSPQNGTTHTPATVAPQLQNMLNSDLQSKNNYWGQFCAGAVIVAIPTSILFLILQKNYVGGVTGGAVKG